jgi:hypothetical protein
VGEESCSGACSAAAIRSDDLSTLIIFGQHSGCAGSTRRQASCTGETGQVLGFGVLERCGGACVMSQYDCDDKTCVFMRLPLDDSFPSLSRTSSFGVAARSFLF